MLSANAFRHIMKTTFCQSNENRLFISDVVNYIVKILRVSFTKYLVLSLIELRKMFLLTTWLVRDFKPLGQLVCI